jgi:hypothetical protein
MKYPHPFLDNRTYLKQKIKEGRLLMVFDLAAVGSAEEK